MGIAVGVVFGFAGPAQASHPTATPPGADEAHLRAFESEVLGPEHAAEHAEQHRLARYGAPSAAGKQPAAARAPAEDGRWGTPFAMPVVAVHAALLPTGKVMLWSRVPGINGEKQAEAWLWNPASGATKKVDPPLFRDPETGTLKPANIWCSGQSHMADGQLLVTGGNLAYPGTGNPVRVDYAGLNTAYTFNPFNETWTEQPRMGKGRWYPSQALLPDGRSLVMSGLDETGGEAATNKEIELFSPPGALGGRGSIAKITDRGGLGEPPDGDTYPHLAVLPSGRMLVAGPNASDSWLMNSLGTGSVFGWTPLPQLSRRRLWGSGVLRPGGTGGATAFTLIGGSDPDFTQDPPGDARGVKTATTFDESRLGDGWRPAPALNIGRSHHNTVLLPDRSMVTVGGGVGTSPVGGPQDYGAGQWAADDEQRQIELFDPVANSWRLGPAQGEPRAYHSTALLLPDGRVMSAGDDVNGGGNQDTAEIYEPPYLFKGPRPVIGSPAPSTASYGASFDVKSSGPAPARAVLMAPGAVTHANDMSQRSVELALQPRPDGVRLTAPARAELAPPGYYMLFLVSGEGVPSVARFVRLGPKPAAPKPKPKPNSSPAAPEPGSTSSDRTGPSFAFPARQRVRGRTVLRGRVSDPSGVKKMQVAVTRASDHRCRRWSPKRRGFGGASRRACARPAFFTARLRRSGRGYVWAARLGARLARGRYLVPLRAEDRRGNVAQRTGRRAVRVTVR